MTQERVPVLIVGAGGAGLSLSLLLLQQGIHPLLIERRSDISIYPRHSAGSAFRRPRRGQSRAFPLRFYLLDVSFLLNGYALARGRNGRYY